MPRYNHVTNATASPTFVARTMSKGELTHLYGLSKTAQLREWCRRVGIELPPKVHLLDPNTVALIIERIGAPHITISAARM